MATRLRPVLLLFAALVALIQYVHSQTYEGDGCAMKDGSRGVCRKLADCKSARDSLPHERPTICSYKAKVAVVCCKVRNIAEEKCAEYASEVFYTVRVESLLIDQESVTESSCAQGSQELIVGGVEAAPREFPHMAELGYGDEEDIHWGCGGSLISDLYILTAAHCLAAQGRGTVRWALLGDLNYASTDDDSRPMLTEVAERIRHPDYTPVSRYNDIALLKLTARVVFNIYVRPACLNTIRRVPVFGRTVIATGWGLTEYNNEEGSPSLRKVALNVDLASKCNSTNKFSLLVHGFDEASMICAGDPSDGKDNTWKDTCGGDSGAPLQVILQSPYCMYSILGVTSFGDTACGVSPSPAVYSRVSYFLPWIESIVWPN